MAQIYGLEGENLADGAIHSVIEANYAKNPCIRLYVRLKCIP